MKIKLNKKIIIVFITEFIIGMLGSFIGITQQWDKVSKYGMMLTILSFCHLIALILEEKLND